MSLSTTSQARALKQIDSGREMNKTRKIGWDHNGQLQLVQPERHNSSSDYFFPMGSVVMMKKPKVTQAPPCMGVPFGESAR
jgi:hypothetical protein